MPSKKKRTAKKQVTGRQRSVSQTEPTDLRKITNEKPHSLVREMEIRQTELQLRNEHLRKALMEAGEIRDHYSTLHEYAPIAYITLDGTGQIVEANLAAANMLGIQQQILLRSNISKFVSQEYQGAWYFQWKAAFSSKTKLA